MDKQTSPAQLQKAVGISRSYASMLLKHRRTPAIGLAIRIFEATGLRLGPVAGASETEIRSMAEVLARSNSIDPANASLSQVPTGRTVGTGAPIVPCDRSAETQRSARA